MASFLCQLLVSQAAALQLCSKKETFKVKKTQPESSLKSYLPEQRSDYSVLRSKLLRFRHFNVTGSTTTTLSSLTNLTYLHVRIGYKPRIRPFEAFTLSNDRATTTALTYDKLFFHVWILFSLVFLLKRKELCHR